MGSIFEYISIEKAAEGLNVTTRQVYHYIKNGRLRTIKEGQKQLVKREDVKRIIDERKGKGPPVVLNRETFRQHEARIHKLEMQVNFLLRASDLHKDPLDLTAKELATFHQMAHYCLQESWAPQEEETWVEIFLRMRLEDLDLLATVVTDEEPWLVFHSLCRAMLARPHDQDLKTKLDAGKTNLEQIAYIWATSHRVGPKQLDRCIRAEQKYVNKLIRRVTHRRSKNRSS